MTRRIFNTTFGTTMLTLIVSLVVFTSIVHRSFETQIFNALSNEAVFIVQGIEQNGIEFFDGLVSENRITYIADDGTVIFDNQSNPAQMDNHKDRQEIVEAKESGEGISSRYSNTISVNTLYYAKALDNGDVLRVASDQNTIWAQILSLIPPMITVMLVVAIICAFLAQKLSDRITKPIIDLDLDHPEDCSTYDELSPLILKIRHQNQTIEKQMALLRKNQEEFKTITENMSEGFLLVDDKTNLLSYNSSAIKLLGAKNVISGESVLTIQRSSDFCKVLDAALAGKHAESLIHIGERCHQLFASPVFGKSEVVGAVIAILDVTEREKREQLRREFTANVTHELKTPLTSISGFAELMQNSLVPPEAIPEFAGDIYTEAQRLIVLVNDILHLSRLEEGIVHSLEEVELLPLCEDIVQRLKRSADKQGISIKIEGDPVAVKSAPRTLDEIIFNITENAIKYNRENGSVKLKIIAKEGRTTLEISDTGIGIKRDEKDRVFERFYRVDKSHSKEIGGTGLGLSIVKHGCATLGISLELTSKYNKGSTFRLTWKN